MRKNGKGSVVVILLILVIMVIAGGFYAYKNDFFRSKEVVVDEKIEEIEETPQEEENTIASVLELYKEKLDGQDSYALTDINNDGMVDLITYKEETASDKVVANYTLYSYLENEVVELGKIPGKKDQNLLYKMKDNTLLAVYGYMNHEKDTVYVVNDKKLEEKSTNQKDISQGENYTRGDEYIPFDFVTDTIQFEMYE